MTVATPGETSKERMFEFHVKLSIRDSRRNKDGWFERSRFFRHMTAELVWF